MTARTPVPESLRGGPFTVAAARAAGMSAEALRSSRFVRLHRGIYVPSDVEQTFDVHVDAVQLALGSGFAFSHDTAALLRNLPTPARRNGELEITVDRSRHPSLTGVRVHRSALTDRDVEMMRGRPTTIAPRTFVDLAAVWPLADVVALGDAATRRGLSTTASCARTRPQHAAVPV